MGSHPFPIEFKVSDALSCCPPWICAQPAMVQASPDQSLRRLLDDVETTTNIQPIRWH